MTKIEELRMDIIRSSRDIDPHKVVDALILAVQHVAVERGRAEGAALEHEFIFNMIRASCCYPIDGDKLFSKTLPKTYGDALPIKET